MKIADLVNPTESDPYEYSLNETGFQDLVDTSESHFHPYHYHRHQHYPNHSNDPNHLNHPNHPNHSYHHNHQQQQQQQQQHYQHHDRYSNYYYNQFKNPYASDIQHFNYADHSKNIHPSYNLGEEEYDEEEEEDEIEEEEEEEEGEDENFSHRHYHHQQQQQQQHQLQRQYHQVTKNTDLIEVATDLSLTDDEQTSKTMHHRRPRGCYQKLTESQVQKLVNYVQDQHLSVRKASILTNIPYSTASRYIKLHLKESDGIFSSSSSPSISSSNSSSWRPSNIKRGRPPILNDEHTSFIMGYLEENPSSTIDALHVALHERFHGNTSKKTLYRHVKDHCRIPPPKSALEVH